MLKTGCCRIMKNSKLFGSRQACGLIIKIHERCSDMNIKIIIIIAVIAMMFYKCPIKAIFNIDCPGCGMTRALKSAIQLDFAQAFSYHQLFFVPILCVIYQLFRNKLKVSKRIEAVSAVIILLIFIIRWIIIYL